jgi:hypothetical protein
MWSSPFSQLAIVRFDGGVVNEVIFVADNFFIRDWFACFDCTGFAGKRKRREGVVARVGEKVFFLKKTKDLQRSARRKTSNVT